MRKLPAALLVGPVLLALYTAAVAQTPPEVSGLDMASGSTLLWDPAPGAADYNVYRGQLSWLAGGDGAACHADELVSTSFITAADPPLGTGYYYLVTAESAAGEGTAGTGSGGSPRVLRGGCDAIMRRHVANRLGYGGDEWTRARLIALGPAGHIAEQLDPATIDESSNTELATRLGALGSLDSLQELASSDIVRAVYARRQLEQLAVMFWDNHFNTLYLESFQFFGFYQALFPAKRGQEAVKFHHDMLEIYRDLAFNGTFRQVLEAMTLSPPMILFLNTDQNVAASPNENFARELLELHSMGVDGGYTQQDVVELARVFTGWNVCKKDTAVAADPLAACIPRNTYGTVSEPPGLFVNNFRTAQHDTGQKVLFAGTPHQAIVPSTAGNPSAGVNDVQIALDAIVAHPSTPRFMARKLLQRFVTENPPAAMIDAVVAEWNDASNPQGVGDLREVLRAVLTSPGFLDPDRVGGKIKTPFEQVTSALRGVRGLTNGQSQVQSYLTRMQEVLHSNPVPTGYSELGGDWLDTNNLLERQNFGYDMATRTATTFGADVIGLLNDNGVSTSPTPNNAPAIVDFLASVLFAGALTPAERQEAIDYLNTDDSGVPAAYTNARIRETAGFLLGLAQFIEQ
ncbi:MAG: DUF1800 domain-containing protein [Candidatus Polarisedimenticolia bacterium]